MASARPRRQLVRRALALVASAALAAVPMASIGVVASPAPVAAAGPIAPSFAGAHTPDLLEIANAGTVDLTQPPASGPANPDPASVTEVAGGAALQSASILKSDLTGSQLAATTLVSLRLDALPIQIPLSTIPLTRTTAPKTWTDVLAGTALAGIPLVNVTWSQVVALGASMPSVVGTLTLADVDWSGSALANLPLAALTFGGQDITTVQIPLQAGEPSTDTTAAQRWCYLLNQVEAGSCSSPASLAGKSLIRLGVEGAPLKNIPLKNIPLKNIDLASSPLKNIPLKNIVLAVSPLKNIPLKNIDLANSPLKNIPLKNILLDAAGSPTASPLKNIPLKNINFASSPLKNIPLKNIDFASSPLKNIPLKNIDFATAPLKNIPLKNIDLAASGLGAAPLAALDWTSAGLASAGLSLFTLSSGPLSSIAVASLRNPANVVACAATGTCPAGATLGSLSSSILPGATLGDIGSSGFGSLTLSDLLGARISASAPDPVLGDLRLDLAGDAAPAITIGGLALAVTAGTDPVLGDLDAPSMAVSPLLGDLGLNLLSDTGITVSDLLGAMAAGSPDLLLGDLSLDTMANAPALTLAQFLATLSSSQPDVTLGDLRLDTATGVDALVLDAVTGFLLDPNDLAGYLLGALGTYTDATGRDITLGELGTWTSAAGQDITLGQLAQYLDDSVSLADVLLGLVPPSQFPFENFPISSLGLNEVGRQIVSPMGGFSMPGAGGFAASYVVNQVSSMSMSFDDNDPFNATTPADFDFTLPVGATFSSVSVTSFAGAVATPGVTTSLNASGQTVVRVPDISIDPNGRDSFDLSWTNGMRIGSAGIAVSVYSHADGSLLASGTYPIVTVQDGSEPNTPQEAIAVGFGSPAALRVPNLPTNPNGCSSVDTSCTGRDPTYVDALAPGFIDRPGDVDWFRIQHVKAGSRITADLSNLPVSADLVIYGPAGIQASPTLFPPAAQGLPGSLVEDPGLGVGQAARALAVDRLNDVWLDPGYTDPVLAAAGDPNSTFAPMTPLSIAQASGTDPESAGVIAPVDGDYVVQVGGYNTAHSNDPYLLRVRVLSPAAEAVCPARSFPNPMPAVTSSMPTIGPNVNALILTDPSRLAATYGSTDAGSVASSLSGLVSWFGSNPAQGVTPAVVPLDAYPAVQDAYAAWDANPCSVSAANAVATQVTKVIADIRASDPSVASVTIVGGDDIIPMGRTPDLTRVSNEAEYASTFADSPNPLSAAEAAGYTLTDDNYGDPSPTPIGNGSSLFVPAMAVGRLVEQPADIVGQVTEFEHNAGTLDTSTGLVTGYDFLADGASAVAQRLSVGGRSIDSSLIDAPGSGSTPWTAAQLDAKLFPSGGATPLVDAINAHYDHTALLSDAGNVNNTTDVLTAAQVAAQAGATSLLGRVLFTMGCHAGLAVPDAYISATDPSAAKLRGDWAQTLSAAGVAVYVANTGFGIGDTSSVAYSERLMALYAKLLDGSVTAGQALAYAKQAYFGSLGAVGVYDLKILQQAEFYGLPFWKVSTTPGQTPPAPVAPALPGTISTDATTGLQAMPLTVSPSFTKVVTAGGGAYWTTGTDDPQVTQFQPIQPKTTESVAAAGQTAHGALITALVSHDVAGVVPVVNTPTVDSSAASPQVRADSAAWPARLATITTSQAPYGRAQSLVLVPGQFLGSTYDGSGVQRLFDTVGVNVLYAPDSSTDFTPPTISGVAGAVAGTTVTFGATATDDGAVKEVTVGYRDLDGTWKFAAMSGGPSQFSATVTLSRAATASDLVSFFIQAVDDSGNVGVSAGKGAGFAASSDVTPPTITAVVDPAPDANGWIPAASATVSYECADAGSGVAPGACPAPQTVTAQGATVLTATTVDRAGNTASVDTTVRLDGTAPTVSASVQPAGWSSAASATVTFTCSDAVSGLDAGGCPAPVTVTAEGTTTVTGTATDLAGNSATATATVQLDRTAPTITASVVPAPNAAGWSKGTSGTVHFTCADSGSGVASCPADVPVSEGVAVVGGTAADEAGNTASASVTARLDGTAPNVQVLLSPYPTTASCGTTDALSGVAVPAALSATTARDQSGIPMTTATCTGGTDVAGNVAAPVTQTFVAPMSFTGFLSPVNNPPVVNTGKAGRTYPVKFQLQDAGGAYISSLKAVAATTYSSVACTAFSSQTDELATSTTSSAGLQYDATSNQYIYTWQTPGTAGCYVFKLSLLDGSSYTANFSLK